MPELVQYRLSLGPDVEPFRLEIEYVFNVVERWYPISRAGNSGPILHYGASSPLDTLRIPAALFPKAVHVDKRGIHLNRSKFISLKTGQGPVPLLGASAASPGKSLAYDAIGLIFFMLSRIEERDAPSRDQYGRFPLAAALTAQNSQHAEPIADIAAADIATLLAGKKLPASTAYSVRLTHDVDILRGYHRPLAPVRAALGDLVRRKRPEAMWQRLHKAYFSGEPWTSFRDIMTSSEQYGLSSHFYFMGPSTDSRDSPYAVTMKSSMHRLVGEIYARGHHIGFHPGAGTIEDAIEWNRQRDGLQDITGRPVREGRQHVLMYRAEDTPDIWDRSGMELECSLAYPEASGFRPGTCRHFPAYSLVKRQQLNLIQAATMIMDFGFFGGKYRDLDVDAALEECRPIITACRRFGGELNILFHTGQPKSRAHDFYQRLLPLAL